MMYCLSPTNVKTTVYFEAVSDIFRVDGFGLIIFSKINNRLNNNKPAMTFSDIYICKQYEVV
jgi:hypothetical protein